jgi:GT2 family glycosyltransferase
VCFAAGTTAAAPPVKTSVIFNYFNPKRNAYLQRTALYALESLVQTTSRTECEIVCADGSGSDCDALAGFARAHELVYAPSARPEMFAETYNRGCEVARGDVLVLCASDIVVNGPWLGEMVGHLERTGAAMVCPYLSYADYIAQCYSAPLRRSTFAPCCLTINVNAIRAETWQTVGPLDVSYTGNYNDIDYLIRLRKHGLQAVVADCGLISHLGSATLSVSSQLRREQDEVTFAQKNPEFATKDFWHKCWHPLLCRSAVLRLGLRAALKTAPQPRRWLRVVALLRYEALFNRV